MRPRGLWKEFLKILPYKDCGQLWREGIWGRLKFWPHKHMTLEEFLNLTLGALGLYLVSLSSLPSNLPLPFTMATFYPGTKCITSIKVCNARVDVNQVMGRRELRHLGEADLSWWRMAPLCPLRDGPTIHHSHSRTEVELAERFRVKSWPGASAVTWSSSFPPGVWNSLGLLQLNPNLNQCNGTSGSSHFMTFVQLCSEGWETGTEEFRN